jgi:hypothetical protein
MESHMPVLIDGHNLIAHMPNLRLSDSDDEAQLVMILRRYATRKRQRRVIVVFDHGVYGHPQNLNGYGVECHFAHSPQDADSELIRRIRKIRRRGEWQVVTSDRAVAGEARAHRIVVISSQQFAQQLLKPPRSSARMDRKYSEKPLSKQEIEDWLREFGVEEDENEEFF